MTPFKDALCLAKPDDMAYNMPLHCKRHRGHKGKHRIAYRDGNYRTWNRGDGESVVESMKGYRDA